MVMHPLSSHRNREAWLYLVCLIAFKSQDRLALRNHGPLFIKSVNNAQSRHIDSRLAGLVCGWTRQSLFNPARFQINTPISIRKLAKMRFNYSRRCVMLRAHVSNFRGINAELQIRHFPSAWTGGALL